MKVITSFDHLMRLAKRLGDARLSGDEKRIEEAKKAHDAYVQICLSSDEMMTGMTRGGLQP